ncbi:CPBP family intramembrane metalloprotease [Salinibacterium sp. dk2585]|uniref:CPBP family intramembrane glutamic endopeptidase n=1 Tax=unclassified Salinibacterium TaxID=2632331 RepID=UPI0011C2442C|nr:MULTISPECIES: type II CAAX endopeptidase family protein [unclassified Salinibacterium]QEE61174.1 CPBP family intramembrane metalloprotease [Salinibacterium sp. dk2585]TXK53849.1 CPBP family intramembrane metalloprotease [Salinibacterium sp. dk5596]
MKKLHDVQPVWHAVVWIVAYVLLVSVGDWASELFGEPNSATAPLLLVFSIALVLYVIRNGWARRYGLRPIRRDQFRGTLLYLPLAVLVVLQFANGFRERLDLMTVLLIILLMIGVGIVEEVLFRGFLFRAILNEGSLARAVAISGVTFGIGHILNLARGYTGTEQIIQVAGAIVIGVVLTLLFAVSGTIVPLIAFHALFNIGGSLTEASAESEWRMLGVTVIIGAAYAVYLAMVLRRRGVHPTFSDDPSPAGESAQH